MLRARFINSGYLPLSSDRAHELLGLLYDSFHQHLDNEKQLLLALDAPRKHIVAHSENAILLIKGIADLSTTLMKPSTATIGSIVEKVDTWITTHESLDVHSTLLLQRPSRSASYISASHRQG